MLIVFIFWFYAQISSVYRKQNQMARCYTWNGAEVLKMFVLQSLDTPVQKKELRGFEC